MFPTESQRLAQQQRPPGFPVMRQRWAELGFFHWAFDPDVISARLPKGLHVDTFDGKAWMGIVPFLMQRVRPVGLPPLPWLSWFHELNLRTYVFDENGNPGVWFFSLDCNQPLAVEIARRSFHLPYEHAEMSSEITPRSVHYSSTRKSHPAPEAVYEYTRPVAPLTAKAGSLEWFLVERYSLFSTGKSGNLYNGRVHHHPYQIEPMGSGTCPATAFVLNGFPEPETEPDSMLSAAPVDVTIFPLRKM